MLVPVVFPATRIDISWKCRVLSTVIYDIQGRISDTPYNLYIHICYTYITYMLCRTSYTYGGTSLRNTASLWTVASNTHSPSEIKDAVDPWLQTPSIDVAPLQWRERAVQDARRLCTESWYPRELCIELEENNDISATYKRTNWKEKWTVFLQLYIFLSPSFAILHFRKRISVLRCASVTTHRLWVTVRASDELWSTTRLES